MCFFFCLFCCNFETIIKQYNMVKVYHNVEERKFIIDMENQKAFLSYRLVDHTLDLRHTYVPPSWGGRGLASTLVHSACDYAMNNGLDIVATCSYAVKWLMRHPEYRGRESSDYCGDGLCTL